MPLPLAPRGREDLAALKALSVFQRHQATGATGTVLKAPRPVLGFANTLPTLSPGAPRYSKAVSDTGSVFSPDAGKDGPEWGVRSAKCCGLRGDRCMLAVHGVALVVHLTFAIVCLAFTAQADDPYLESTRPQFLFTRNGSFCGLQSPTLPTAEDRPIAVVVGTGTKLNIGIMSAFFFVLSALAHMTWVLALIWDPIGNVLLGWLDDAYCPLRWAEYSISAPLMLTVLTMLSGLRNKDQIASVWWLCGTTQFFGYLTEVQSRPDKSSNGERWEGQREDNRFANYCWRMQAHGAPCLAPSRWLCALTLATPPQCLARFPTLRVGASFTAFTSTSWLISIASTATASTTSFRSGLRRRSAQRV